MEPLVTVCMITYNHEPYIQCAIESVLMQKTSFHFELVLAEDYSRDNTRRICENFAVNYPDIIRLLPSDKNYGMMANFRLALEASRGKYIALLEGDDYWIAEHKLKRQVEFLEAHPDFAICYHRVNELFPDGKCVGESMNTSSVEAVFTIDQLAKGNFMHTPSVMFRNTLFYPFPDWFNVSPVGDYVLHMLNARYGKIWFFPEIMAVYRVGVGVHGSKSKDNQLRNWRKTIQLLLGLSWTDEVRKNLIYNLRVTKEIIRRNKYKTVYRIWDLFVDYTGLRFIRKFMKDFLVN